MGHQSDEMKAFGGLSVDVRPTAQGSLFTLRGGFDHGSAVQLPEIAERALAGAPQPAPVKAEGAGLTFCDSSGITRLSRQHPRLSAQDAGLRLAAVPAPVARVFTLMELDRAFGVHATLHQAVSAGNAVEEQPGNGDRPSLRSASER
ncbi:STAS domain-containing protein [Streptomyces sp. NPDC028635]|uniref:STAS domain-containing protein n=1 Tax=Streptomyces sp. NPDC028635 TaxID=3154800 RepID=UPI0033E03346